MNRRRFLLSIGTLIGGIAIEQAVPFGRVYSFPSIIKPLNCGFELDFCSADLNLSIDSFSTRILQPALATLAKEIEIDIQRYCYQM